MLASPAAAMALVLAPPVDAGRGKQRLTTLYAAAAARERHVLVDTLG
ncbi:hypothetical protein [Streptomyces sp. NPDC021356]